jgi:Putative prokaryotic signal transducing protein
MFPKRTAARLDPRFCPNCKKSAPDDEECLLCPECGDRLIPQGYCPVCEHFWRLAEEVLCPKHDIPLEAGPPASSEPAVADQMISWVTVKQFPDSLSAAIPRSRLEAEGIPTFVAGERMDALAAYQVATGGAKLQVPAEQVAEARIILSQNWSLPGDEKDDFDDLL